MITHGSGVVSTKKWQRGVHAEIENYWDRLFENDTVDRATRSNWNMYREVMGLYVKNLDIKILDLGCGPNSLLNDFHLGRTCWLVDPDKRNLFSDLNDGNYRLVLDTAENFTEEWINRDKEKFDEVWICNLMTHVMDPFFILENLPAVARRLRICEPTNTPIDISHHFSFDPLDYIKHLSHISTKCYFKERRDEEFLYFGGVFELKE